MILILSGVMCSVLMLKLRGFKASFNLLSGNKHGGEKYEKSSDIPVLGAYRRNKEEYYVVNNIPNNSPRKLTPTINSNQPKQRIQHAKSTSNLLTVEDVHQNTRKSTSDIPSSGRERKQSREHSEKRKTESQKPEQGKREKPPRKQENLKKLTKETSEQPHQDKPRKEKKGRAPKPPIQQHPEYSSNTLESSISRSSGPPPYSAEVVPNENDNTGNTSFSKPVEESSWDLVSQHREQLNRPQTKSTTKPKSRVLDLNYNAITQTSVEVVNNSEV